MIHALLRQSRKHDLARLIEHPLRIWDFVGDDLLAQHLPKPWAQSRHLGGYWLPIEEAAGGLSLRLSRDEHGLDLFPTPAEYEAEARRSAEEALRLATAAHRLEAEAHRLETEARVAAEQRVAELEAELKRRS